MKLSELTALYTVLDTEYAQVMSGPYEDLSVRNEDCEVVAALKNGRISGFWRPMVMMGSEKALKLQSERLWAISQNWTFMDFLVNGELSVVSKFLLKRGYVVRPVYSQIVDLTKPENELHAGLRKSYTSLCNYCCPVDCYTGPLSSPSTIFIPEPGGINEFGFVKDMVALRKRLRGTLSRPKETWIIQERMVRQGQAFILGSRRPENQQAAYVLIYHNDKYAYYACGMNTENFQCHHLIWNAILRVKETGCKMFELGEQVYHIGHPMMESGKMATEKDVNISAFKRGFGGITKIRLILEKSYVELL